MLRFQKVTFSAIILTTALALSSVIANAQMYQEQYQHTYQKSSFSYDCDGSNCGGSAEVRMTNKAEQSQSQGIGNYQSRGRVRNWDRSNGWKYDYNRDTTGQVILDWDHRGGTCHVRYTEASAKSYKYFTAASCDDGSITIGGLQTGVRYRFQVKKDNEGWSQPITATAN